MRGPATPPPDRSQRRVGLDKPCARCGEAIYFNYKGPVEGICGKCADRVKKKPKRKRTPRPATRRSSGRRRAAGLLLAAAVAVAAFIMYSITRG